MKETNKNGFNKYIGSEDNFQISIARYLDNIGCLWCHVPNEGKHNAQYRKKQASKGLKSGVCDVLIFEPNGEYYGLAIELKVGYNKPSENQIFWLGNLKLKNWQTECTNSLDEAINIIDKYFNNEL